MKPPWMMGKLLLKMLPYPNLWGTKFALVTGGNAVVQLDDKFNVKFG